MIKPQTKTLPTAKGTATFTIPQLPGMRAGKLLTRIVRQFGPGVTGLVRFADAKSVADALASEALPPAVAGLVSQFDEATLEALTRELLEEATVKVGNEELPVMPNFDDLFTGHVGEWFALVAFALQVNFGNFPGAFARALGFSLGLAKAKAAMLTKAPTT